MQLVGDSLTVFTSAKMLSEMYHHVRVNAIHLKLILYVVWFTYSSLLVFYWATDFKNNTSDTFCDKSVLNIEDASLWEKFIHSELIQN